MILPTADRSKASITVKVAFSERDPAVLPEMSAKVAFLSRPPTDDERTSFRAGPAAAVVERNGRPIISGSRGRHPGGCRARSAGDSARWTN